MSSSEQDRFCGNCENHVSYEYPMKIFCSIRYEKGVDPIVNTLWHCEDWTLVTQGCHCVQEAQKEKAKANE